MDLQIQTTQNSHTQVTSSLQAIHRDLETSKLLFNIFPRYGKATGYKLTATPRLVHDPISMLLTLLASLCIHAILLHSRPIIPSSNDLQRESFSSDMASTNAFVKLLHDTGILISTYASEDWVGITMME